MTRSECLKSLAVVISSALLLSVRGCYEDNKDGKRLFEHPHATKLTTSDKTPHTKYGNLNLFMKNVVIIIYFSMF